MNYTLHLSSSCSMRCTYCYAPPRDGPVMSRETAGKTLDLAGRTQGPRGSGIVFFGGEPLLHKDLIAWIVSDARERMRRGEGRFHFKITTNGLALDDAFLDACDANHVQVAMSFDGIREAHDRHRHLPGGQPTFDLLLPRLRLLLARRPFASVYLVVGPQTVRWMEESVCFLLDQGARYLVISLDHAGPWDDASLSTLEAQYTALADRYLAWSRAGRKFYLSPFEVKIASHVLGDAWQNCRCSLAEHQVSVDADGSLYPCVQFVHAGPRWRVGHVDTGFDTAAQTRLREASCAQKSACEGCYLVSRCQHTCGCLNLQTTGSITEVSPVLCRHEQILTPLADRVGATLFAEGNREFLRKHYDPSGPFVSLLEEIRV